MSAEEHRRRTDRPLLDVHGLVVEYRKGRKPFRAVDGVDLTVAEGETLGLVGESGSGKTTIGRAILGLVPVSQGSISFEGTDWGRLSAGERRRLGTRLRVVFQDPYRSLNPTKPIERSLTEMLSTVPDMRQSERRARARAMLERVGMASDVASRYPSQFSGGQRQRIAIARALMSQPRLIICDEPVSALDLSIQAQILNLLTELQRDLGVAYLFVSHDIAVIRRVSHRVAVLYRGKVMETGPAKTVCSTPRHPYTRKLLDAVPIPDPVVQAEHRARRFERERVRESVSGAARAASSVGFAADLCPYRDRCDAAIAVCMTDPPPTVAIADDSIVVCHRGGESIMIDSTADERPVPERGSGPPR
jgi:peptide/nickel transport system ATP-binding protein